MMRGHPTRRPGGDTPSLARSSGWRDGQEIAASFSHRNSVRSFQMRKRTTASLRASATFAFFAPTRFIRRTPQDLRGGWDASLCKALQDQQLDKAMKAEILTRALARTAIVALVD